MAVWFWVVVAVVVVGLLAWAAYYDRKMRAQGRSLRSGAGMAQARRELRRDVRATRGPTSAVSNTAAGYAVRRRNARLRRRSRQPDDGS